MIQTQSHNRRRGRICSILAAVSLTACFCLSAAAQDAEQTEAMTEQTESLQETDLPGEGSPYHENEWNFVDGSMDVSGGIPEDASGALARIRESGKLTVATDPYYAPQEFIDPALTGQAQYVGADMELARLIAERMGVELEIVPLEFTEVLSSISKGAYDLAISGLAYTPSRASSMELSKGYHFSEEEASTGLLIRTKDADRIISPEDLADKYLVAQSGSLQELLLAENVPFYAQFKRVHSTQSVYDAVSDGSADAAGVDRETAQLYLKNNPDCGLMLVPDVSFQLQEQFLGDRIAGPKDELELMYFVNGVIDEVLASGQYEDWFASYASYAADLGL